MKETEVVEKEVEKTELKKPQTELEGHLIHSLHDMWATNGDSMEVVLFLEEMKTYWQARAIAEMCEYNGALADFLKSGIETGLRESL